MKPTSLFLKCIAAGLAYSLFSATCFIAAPAAQNLPQDPAAEKAQRQLEKFREKDFLEVKLNDKSRIQGCLKGSEGDGFLIAERAGSEKKILYTDVAEIKRVKRSTLRVILGVATWAGLMLGVVKIGSNTPKIVALKIYLGMAVTYIAFGGDHFPPCP